MHALIHAHDRKEKEKKKIDNNHGTVIPFAKLSAFKCLSIPCRMYFCHCHVFKQQIKCLKIKKSYAEERAAVGRKTNTITSTYAHTYSYKHLNKMICVGACDMDGCIENV